MNRTTLALGSSFLAIAALTSVALAQQQGGPFDAAGRAVKRGLQTAGQAVQGGLQTAGQAVQGGFQKTRTSVHNMEVIPRVYSRLHWDKSLTTSSLELEVRDGGVAILTGVVPDAAAKAKALMLTAETVGVFQVVDQVVIAAGPGRPLASPVIPGTPPLVIPLPSGDIPL